MLINFNMPEDLIWAICVSAPAAIISLSVLLFAKFDYLPVFTAAFCAGAIRLLLMIIGTAIIIYFVHVAVLPFLIYLFVLYSIMLIGEIGFAIKILNEKSRGLTIVGFRNIS